MVGLGLGWFVDFEVGIILEGESGFKRENVGFMVKKKRNK